MNLRDYVKIYSNWIEKNKCAEIISDLKSVDWQKHIFYDSLNNVNVSRSGEQELDVTFSKTQHTDYVMQRSWDAYHKYIVEDFNFPWFSHWNGFSQVRFNRYQPDQTMALHCDHIASLFDGVRKGIPILTALGCLNNDYTGGEFIMWDEKIDLTAGDMIVFPSVFLYPHKVNPVLKGERYSFVTWAW